ncbi:hypothetical protein [Shimia sediminis]|uniref:hypothetical protein n=1 Tax=Shimia sediminis TaxID=2497945 RepID=UPI000F8C4A05|nr:hypothetical protein [Shimia sediminis]
MAKDDKPKSTEGVQPDLNAMHFVSSGFEPDYNVMHYADGRKLAAVERDKTAKAKRRTPPDQERER